MSFSSLRIRVRACFGFRLLAIGILLWPVAAFAQPSGDIITVNVDQAKLLRLPTRVATIVVGNPLIADVTLQTGGGGVLTGKGLGPDQFIFIERHGGNPLGRRHLGERRPPPPFPRGTGAESARGRPPPRFPRRGTRG